MSKSKKIRGSAYTASDGTFIFTPYAITPEQEKSLRIVYQGRYASLWMGRKSASVRLVFDLKYVPPYEVWIEEITGIYNKLNQEIQDDI